MIGYADCFSGISGDMLLGALIHCGADQHLLRDELDKLDTKEKLTYYSKNGKIFDTLFSQQFDRTFLVSSSIWPSRRLLEVRMILISCRLVSPKFL